MLPSGKPRRRDGDRGSTEGYWSLVVNFAIVLPNERVSIVPQDKRHSVDLTPDLERAIQRRLDSGAYESDIEVIRAGLRALDRDDEENARRLAKVDNSIARGVADADAGRVHPADEVYGELRKGIERKAETRGR
jgi:antitoxin ParD1/3/4